MNSKAPQHVAIIMDGNGRWAERKGLPRISGHEVGLERVEDIINAAPRYGIKYLTLYAFSKENWQRPAAEVGFLMDLLARYVDQKVKKIAEAGGVFNAIGDLIDLPVKIQERIRYWMDATRGNPGLVSTFALSYSSRFEITEACRRIAAKTAAGELKPENINEAMISDHLYTAGLPDPDLLIRTSGEMRISNFLLWQISYAELYVTEKLWPEFTEEELSKAVNAFQKRERRFGRSADSLLPRA